MRTKDHETPEFVPGEFHKRKVKSHTARGKDAPSVSSEAEQEQTPLFQEEKLEKKHKWHGPKKSKKSQSDEHEKEQPQTVVKGAAKKQKKMGIGTVVAESVVETVWVDFMENKPGVLRVGNSIYCLGALLYCSNVGGLSKKQKGDKDKGAILERLKGGGMRYLLTPHMIELDCIVFIPDSVTLAAMEEYTLLRKCPYYELCLVEPEGSVIPLGLRATFQELSTALQNSQNEGDMGRLLLAKRDAAIKDGIAVEPSVMKILDNLEHIEKDEPVENKEETVMREIASQMDAVVSTPAPESEHEFRVDDDISFEEEPQPEMDFEPYDQNDESGFDKENDESEGMNEEQSQEETVDDTPAIPVEDTEKTVMRRFYSDDLELIADTRMFDESIAALYEPKKLDIAYDEKFLGVSYDETFLGRDIRELVKTMNDQLRQLHVDNLSVARQKYMDLLVPYIEQVVRMMNYQVDTGSEYYEAYHKIEEQYQEKLDGLDAEVQRRTDDCEMEFSKRIEEFAETAANKARQEYRDKYGAEHQEEVRRIKGTVTAELEAEHQSELKAFFDARRLAAQKRRDAGITGILNKIQDYYETLRRREDELYGRYQARLMKIVNDNRENEYVRIRTLQMELDQKSLADRERTESVSKLSKAYKEYEAEKQKLSDEIERLKKDAAVSAEAMRTNYENTISSLKSDLATADERAQAKAQSALDEKDATIISLEKKIEVEDRIHKKGTRIVAVLMIVALIAAVAIGFISGAYINLKSDRESVKEEILAEIDEYAPLPDGIEVSGTESSDIS